VLASGEAGLLVSYPTAALVDSSPVAPNNSSVSAPRARDTAWARPAHHGGGHLGRPMFERAGVRSLVEGDGAIPGQMVLGDGSAPANDLAVGTSDRGSDAVFLPRLVPLVPSAPPSIPHILSKAGGKMPSLRYWGTWDGYDISSSCGDRRVWFCFLLERV